MTEPTSRAPGRRAPWLDVRGRELRHWTLALLAGLQLAFWSRLSAPEAPGVEAAAPSVSSPRHVVWIDALAPEERPSFTVPDGWVVAPSAAPARSPAVSREVSPSATRVTRVASRARRVRTRSS